MNIPSDLFTASTRWLSILTLTVIFASAAAAQITLDNRASQGAFNSVTPDVNALTWTHTVNACHNCVLYIGVTTYSSAVTVLPVLTMTYTNNATTITPTSVGSQLSPVGTPTIPPTGNSSVQLYRIISPPTGTGTISVTSSVTTNYLFGSSFSFNGVNQTTPNGPWNSASGNSMSPQLTVAGDASGSVILDVLGSTPTAGFLVGSSGQIVCTGGDETTCTRGRRFFSTSFDVGAMGYKYAAGPGTSDLWAMTTSDVWALGAIAITYDGTTAGEVSLEGRLQSSSGSGVGGAIVYAQDMKGEVLSAVSNPFGYFRFNQLASGETYIINVRSKSYTFQPVAVTPTDNLTGLSLIANPQETRETSASPIMQPPGRVGTVSARPR